MKGYVVNYRQGMSQGRQNIVPANSPKDAAKRMLRMLNYSSDSIREIDEYDGSVPICIAVQTPTTKVVRYYTV